MHSRKVALVTGSATGIGAATALKLAARSYDVVIHYRKSQREALASEAACQAVGADTLLFQADVQGEQACKDMVTAAIVRWGRLDALVNNAGITTFSGIDNWDVLSPETFQTVYAVNAVSAFYLARACAPYLKQTTGSICNVSSAAGVLGRGSSVPYLMSKGALNSLTLYLARALAPAIRVNGVCPGFVSSRWFREGLGEQGYEQVKARYEAQTPLGRANTPEDVAAAIVWLIDGAKTVTGELLLLDAGLHLG